ncbi:hypothetical protein [Nonomuraea sp. NPDC050643]|uniref:hypothetical protein n=1 Tax=Nonomuraea sp. NPDC050643 TaxID=3155660 RepID=UPI0033C5466F
MRTRKPGCPAGVAAAALGVSLAATPAQAAPPWLSDPGSCTGVQTARTRDCTAGYPTSSSSARAFRSCYVTSGSATCSSGNSTAWW